MSDSLKVVLTQLCSVDNASLNSKKMIEMLQGIDGADLVCFPENALYQRVVEGEEIPSWKLEDPIFEPFENWCRKKSSNIHLGSVPLEINGKIFNSSIWINASGERKASYQKVHLFDIQLDGQKPIRESDVFSHGNGPEVIDIKGWKIGQSICYDIRFAELYRHYAAQHVDLILVPSSFLVKTGQAHWHVLLRARAIESQAYLLASAQTGTHQSTKSSGQRQTYGHSLLVGPWGEVLLDLDEQESFKAYTLEKKRIQEVRHQIPMKQHRRI